jgi:DNA mismatch repair protein MutL
MKAYENLIPDGVTPTYIIYLDIDPQAIDVNIHPTKTEIKFEDDSVIFQILYACIKEALGKNSFGDSIDFDREGVPDIPAFGKNFDEFRPVSEPQPGVDGSYNPFDNDGFPSEASPFDNSFVPGSYGGGSAPRQSDIFGGSWDEAGQGFEHVPAKPGYGYGASSFIEKRDDYGKLFEDKLAPSKSVLTLQGKYIITTGRSGLMVINMNRAMERILYDRFLNAMSRNEHVTQTALFPVTVQIGVENMCLISEHADLLASLGFDIAPFGVDTIVVNGVPEGYSAEAGKVQTMIGDLMLVLAEDHGALEEMMIANMASRLARLGSLSCDPITNPMEAQRLIEQLFACENAEYTSTGRRVMSLIPTEEIDKKF